jgi:hypothetical protein
MVENASTLPTAWISTGTDEVVAFATVTGVGGGPDAAAACEAGFCEQLTVNPTAKKQRNSEPEKRGTFDIEKGSPLV